MATATFHVPHCTLSPITIPTTLRRTLRDLATVTALTLQATALAAGLWLTLAAPGLLTAHASTVALTSHQAHAR